MEKVEDALGSALQQAYRKYQEEIGEQKSLCVHFLVHETYEAPGAIADWVKERRHTATYTRFHAGDVLPESVDDIDFLIVMGGPQSPETTLEECPHFDSKKEQEFIKQCIDANKLVLGVCLGAQMIGQSLGAAFEHSPKKEIGVFPLMLTDEGKNDPLFSSFSETFDCGHWHGDMPGLTPDAKVLAISEGCPRQIIKYSDHVYGFQCHFEFDQPCIEALIANSTEELEKHKDDKFVESPDQLRQHDFSEINKKLFQFLDEFVKQYDL